MKTKILILLVIMPIFVFSQAANWWRVQDEYVIELDLIFQAFKTQTPTLGMEYDIVASTLDVYINLGVQYYDTYPTTITNTSTSTAKTFAIEPASFSDIYLRFMNSSPYQSIWSNTAPVNGDSITVGFVLTFNQPKTIHVGMIGDNAFEVYKDGNLVVKSSSTFTYWFNYLHIFPVSVVAGTYYFTFTGVADGTVNDALGGIIWDNSKDELFTNPITKANWTVLASTNDWVGEAVYTSSCNTGYSYNPVLNLCVTFAPLPNLVAGDDVSITMIVPPDDIPNIASWDLDYGDGGLHSTGTTYLEAVTHTYALGTNYTITYEITLTNSSVITVSETISI